MPSGPPGCRSGSLGDRGSEPGPLVWGEVLDWDAFAVDLDLDIFHFSFAAVGFDEVDELACQVDRRAGELDDGQHLGQSHPRLLNLDLDRAYAVRVLKVGLELCLKVGLELRGDLRRVSSRLRDAVNDYLSH